MKEQEEEARLKRVEEYGRKALRRIMQQGLARGWEAWQQQYLEHVGKQRMLKTVASRLMKPKLSASFAHWWRDWEAALRAMQQQMLDEHTHSQMSTQLKLKESQKAVRELKEELAGAKRAAQSGGSEAAKMAQMMKEQEEEAKEKRVLELQQMAARRIAQLSLSRGWRAWAGQCEDARWRRGLLGKGASRLMKPKLSASFTHWWRDWEAAQRRADAQVRRTRAQPTLLDPDTTRWCDTSSFTDQRSICAGKASTELAVT